jgi:hypothetical protein
MTDRQKPHNGRALDGQFKVRQVDVEELLEDPRGADFVRDDVRLGGAVEDVGVHAAEPAKHISELIEENRNDVEKVIGRVARKKRSK